MTAKTTEVVTKFYELMEPLSSDDRRKVISAGMTLLGDAPASEKASSETNGIDGTLPSRAQTWAKQNGVSDDDLAQVFHISNGTVEIIAPEIPGKSKKEQVFNCYLLTGISGLLATGMSSFDDKSARAQCQSSGCYDHTNHATYMKDKGNDLAGSKDKGWSLTNPGLKAGAMLVKQIAQASGK